MPMESPVQTGKSYLNCRINSAKNTIIDWKSIMTSLQYTSAYLKTWVEHFLS